ncbi:AbfB domain-containing protein [Streptomyces sp. NPDC059593]|uniref:AbfB domain-containing protein n=1 Tax=Streptomyces sp. NPDC059593 TaxID=3346878 RepID=UPI0036C0FDDB
MVYRRSLLTGIVGAALILNVALGATLTTGGRATAQPHPTLTVDAGHTTTQVNPTQFGHLIEDIGHSVEGGLSANVVRNGTMTEGGQNPPSSWRVTEASGGRGAIAMDLTFPLTAANPRSLRLDILSNGAGQRVGVANAGFSGIGVRPGTRYRVVFWARATPGFTGPLTVSLESKQGAVRAMTTVTGLTSGWKEYTTTLTTGPTVPVSADNLFVISAKAVGSGQSVWLNVVRCTGPTSTAMGGARKDLERLLAETKPGFLRIPGGNFLQGKTLPNRFQWKNTRGPVENRPGHENDAWSPSYWSTDQFGLLDYLQLAERMGAEPVLGVFAGYTLDGHAVAERDLGPYVRDALDEIEYVIGSTSTVWGARRAADGHPAPFRLKYVEIGNEDMFAPDRTYDEYRYWMFYEKIKARHSHLQIVATAPVDSKSKPMDVLDVHHYGMQYWDNNPSLVTLAGRFDYADRRGPKILVGEYGEEKKDDGTNPTATLADALAEAAFLTGTVRNADIVLGAAYAPAMHSIHRADWPANLIGFDALSSYPSPSYHVLKMFSTMTGDHVVPSSLSGADGAIQQVATRRADGTVYISVVNPTAAAVPITIKLTGATSVSPTASTTTLTGNPDARNSIAAPTTIAPTAGTTSAGTAFVHRFPANSMVVLKVSTTGSATPLLAVDRGISLQATTSGSTNRYVRHQNYLGVTSVVDKKTTSALDKADTSFMVRPGLADSSCYSFEARSDKLRDHYLRHENYRVKLHKDDLSSQFRADATFCATYGNSGQGISLRAYNFRDRYLRHFNNELWIGSNGGTNNYWDKSALWSEDTSWRVTPPWWRSDVDVPTGYHSLRVTTSPWTDHYLRHQDRGQGPLGWISPVNQQSPNLDKEDATFEIVPGLADPSCYSFKSRNRPNDYLRHFVFQVRLSAEGRADDATFCAMPAHAGAGVSWQSYNHPDRYLRHYDWEVVIAPNGGERDYGKLKDYNTSALWLADTTWAVTDPLAP